MEIGYFKKRSLDLLSSKNEERRTYPIARDDLLRQPRKNCPVCDSGDVSVLTEAYLPDGLMFFSTAACCDCLYVFRPVSPSHDWFRKCWRIIAEDEPQIFNPEMEKFRAIRYGHYRSLLGKYNAGKTMLDLGAGYGTGTQIFKDAGFSVLAVEPEINRLKYMRKRYGFRCIDYSAENFIREWQHLAANSIVPISGYDLIIFSQCLEHADYPVFIMKNIGRLLNPGGVLYVEIPLVWEIVEWSDALFLAHKSNFTADNLRCLAESSGFEILEQVQFRNGPDEPLDYGLVLRQTESKVQVNVSNASPFDVERIRRLYRRGLPEDCAPLLDELIRYRVPYIEQFYYTMRLDKIAFRMEDGCVFIER